MIESRISLVAIFLFVVVGLAGSSFLLHLADGTCRTRVKDTTVILCGKKRAP